MMSYFIMHIFYTQRNVYTIIMLLAFNFAHNFFYKYRSIKEPMHDEICII